MAIRKGVFAVRDFPPGCGRNATLSHYVNSGEGLLAAGDGDFVDSHRDISCDAAPSRFPKTVSQDNNPHTCMAQMEYIAESAEGKPLKSQSKVYAVRDFPPFCGRNAPPPTKLDSHPVTIDLPRDFRIVAYDGSGGTTKPQEFQVEQSDNRGMTDFNHDPSVASLSKPHENASADSFSDSSVAPDLAATKSHNYAPQEVSLDDPVTLRKNDAYLVGRRTKDLAKKRVSDSRGRTKKPLLIISPVNSQQQVRITRKSSGSKFGRISKGTITVNLPPISGTLEDDEDDKVPTRSKVRNTLRLFHALCRKLLQAKECNQEHPPKRIDLHAAKILKEKGKYLNCSKNIGSVPGVEVGDEFQYRVELNIVGLHRLLQGGIDFLREGDKYLAVSVVASGAYDDVMDDSDSLIYSGSGGNVVKGVKEAEDQKLEYGNLALKNSFEEKNPIRVIRGVIRGVIRSDTADDEDAKAKKYIYDGLYEVERWWQELGRSGKLVFKFKLIRRPGQPTLAWKVAKKSKKLKVRDGICVDDISKGKELFPICAVNTVDGEKPPPFEYITRVILPSWVQPATSEGCDCSDCSISFARCSCATKNGGEIPYNRNGAIVESKPIVYECGPTCKCPPSCYNRVSQKGIIFPLEIFKTEQRGWGVRSLNSIGSGSFICEYIGEILSEEEADKRVSNDEYLFDIGSSYEENSLSEEVSKLANVTKAVNCDGVDDGFTIDAALCGNIGRFINHSCAPNLYAQNVLYDHEDKRIPHIMLFAVENIPPLQELTYNYHYVVGQIRDSHGNVKTKDCFCGAVDCTRRLY